MNIRIMLLCALVCSAGSDIYGQTGIGTASPDSSAALEVQSTTKGFLAPRMSSAQMTAITAPATGLTVFNTDSNRYFLYTGTAWVKMLTGLDASSVQGTISTLSDADADTRVEVERGSDDDQIRFRLGGTDQWLMTGSRLENVNSGTLAIGRNAGLNEDGIHYNLYYGINAGQGNIVGNYNTAIGNSALKSNISSQNVAVGHQAASSNVSGSGNVAIGTYAQYANTSGSNNISIGNESLRGNLAGSGNIAIGAGAGYYETGSGKLYIDNSTTTTPLIYGDFGTDSLRINGSLNINGNYTLPKTAGTNGYVMQTNGSGQASWVSAATLPVTETDPKVASSTAGKVPRWTGSALSDGLIYDNGSAIGIGTVSPKKEVHISDGSGTSLINASTATYGAGIAITSFQPHVYLEDINQTTGNRLFDLRYYNGRATFSTLSDNGLSFSKYALLSLSKDGRVGINTANPDTTFHVNGTVKITDGTQANGYVLTSDASGNAKWTAPSTVIAETDPQVSSSTTNSYPYWNGTTLVDGNIFRNSSNGSVGIGVSNPAATLETNGSVRFSSTGNADIQLNSGIRPSIYPNGSNVPANLDVQLRSAGTGTLLLNADNTGNISAVAGGGKLMVGSSATPTERLQVAGNIKASDTVKTSKLQLTNGAVSGYVLTSDASGNASWQSAGSVTETDPQVSSTTTNIIPKWNGSTLTDGQLYDNGTQVAIGTTSPDYGNLLNYSRFTIASSSIDNSDLNLVLAANHTSSPYLNFGKARGSLTSLTSAQNGDMTMMLVANAYEGYGYRPTASVSAYLDGFPSLGNTPGRLQFGTTASGNTDVSERMRITSTGNVGINTTDPGAKLDVNGTLKVGSNGSVITNIIKTTVAKNIPSIGANANSDQTFTVTNAATGSTVYISPASDLGSIVIAHARVSATGTVTVKFVNPTSAAIDPADMNFYITVIQ